MEYRNQLLHLQEHFLKVSYNLAVGATNLYSICIKVVYIERNLYQKGITPGPGFEPGNLLRETRLAISRRNRWAIRA